MFVRLALLVVALPLLAQQNGCAQQWLSDFLGVFLQSLQTSLIWALVNMLIGGLFGSV